MDRVLLFGAGVQTTALAILISQGKVKVDRAIFADTGGEKPETYWYMENYTKPLFLEMGIPLQIVKNEQPYYQPDLYGFLWRLRDIPSVNQRHCSDHYKIRPIDRIIGKNVEKVIGFSLDEAYRAKRSRHKYVSFPLIEMGMMAADCRFEISDYGWPTPLKSSCYFCPFQHPVEWLWLKKNHPDLFQKALDLEARYHDRKPQWKGVFGLMRGVPLQRIALGQQLDFGLTMENSCWTGYCGH